MHNQVSHLLKKTVRFFDEGGIWGFIFQTFDTRNEHGISLKNQCGKYES